MFFYIYKGIHFNLNKYSILIVLLCNNLLAQYESTSKNAFMGQEVQQAFDYWNIQNPNQQFHSSFKPYLSKTYYKASDSLIPFKFYSFNNFFLSKMLNEKPEKRIWYQLQLHPLFDAEVGQDVLTNKFLKNISGGTHLKLNINNDFTFAGNIIGGTLQQPFYIDTTFANLKISPEFGQTYGNQKNGYSFIDYTGYLSYSPKNNPYFNLQAGRGKHFIGDGYRSVLLSDFAPAYPFFRVNATIWHFQYNVWYTWMNDPIQAGGIKKNFTNKYGAFHYLSYNILKELNIGLFENVIWRGTDTNQVRTFDPAYLNPIVFYRPQEYSVGSPDNSFLGININAKIFKTAKLYAQLGLDEFFLKEIRARKGWWANKQAWQLGAKYINAFKVKGLSVQLEYNQVRPYTYSHGVVAQNYAHYGYALAHPLGANFLEYLGIINYRKNRTQIQIKGIYAIMGKDSTTNLGSNIYLSYVTRPFEYGHKTGQGIKTNYMQSDIKFTYFLIPDMNLRIEIGYIQQTIINTKGYELQNPYIYFGLKTSFWNTYRDY